MVPMHHIIQVILISVLIGLLGRKLYEHITIPPFVKKCAAVIFGSTLQGLGFALGRLVLSLLAFMLLHR
jgi:hypothetical protein